MSAIDRYLAELGRELPFWNRRRVLAEAEDHLRESAREVGEDEAVARFGAPRELASGFRRVAVLRLAAFAVLAAVAFPVLAYPLVESNLPPAPWPTADTMPGHLRWKLDAIWLLYVVAVGAGLLAAALVRRGGRELVVACAFVLGVLTLAAALNVALSVQWEHAVPGTPGWLLLVAAAQALATLSAAALLVRAARVRPA